MTGGTFHISTGCMGQHVAMTPNDTTPLPLMTVSDGTSMRETFGDKPLDQSTPIGAAALFWLATQDVTKNRRALENLSVQPADWGDYTATAEILAHLSIMQNVMDSTDDEGIKHVKFIELAGDSSAVAFGEAELPDATILTVVSGGTDTWYVWGMTTGWVPTGAQVRGEESL